MVESKSKEFKRVITVTFTNEKVTIEDDGYITDIIELHGISPQLVAGRFRRDTPSIIQSLIVFLKVWESL